MRLPAIRVIGTLVMLSVLSAASATRAVAQGAGGFTFGNRNDFGPLYELYPERMWKDHIRTGTCPLLAVRTRLPNGRLVVRRVPWNPRACGSNPVQ